MCIYVCKCMPLDRPIVKKNKFTKDYFVTSSTHGVYSEEITITYHKLNNAYVGRVFFER